MSSDLIELDKSSQSIPGQPPQPESHSHQSSEPPKVQMGDDFLHDITGVQSVCCYKCGVCTKLCLETDDMWNQSCSECMSCSRYRCTVRTTSENTAMGSLAGASGSGICGTLFLCCAYCDPTSCGKCKCGQCLVWQAMYLGAGGALALAGCCGLSVLGMMGFKKYGAGCTRRCGCASFSKGFE